MSGIRGANNVRTICEVLREINDLVQENSAKDAKIRDLVVEAFEMGKKIVQKLYEYNKEIDKEWWVENKKYERKIKKELRAGLNYKIGSSPKK